MAQYKSELKSVEDDLEEPLTLEDIKEVTNEQPQERFLCDQVALNQGISKLNFWSYILYSLVPGIILTPVHLLHRPLMNKVYGLSRNDQKDLSTLIHAIDLPYSFVVAPILGYLCDKMARKPFMIIGIIVAGLTIMMQPHIQPLYPWYIVNHMIHHLGNQCAHIAPLLADYVHDTTKGRVAGGLATVNSVSHFMTTYAGTYLDLEHNIPEKFHITGMIIIIFGVLVIAIGIKGGTYHLDQHRKKRKLENMERRKSQVLLEDQLRTGAPNSQALLQQIQSLPPIEDDYPPGVFAGLKQARKHPWLIIAFICEFLAITHHNTMGELFQLYCIELDGHESAIRQSIILKNKEQLVHIFAALFFGAFSDKYNKFAIFMGTLFCAFTGTLLITLMPSPYHWSAYVVMFVFGIGNAGFSTVIMNIMSIYPDAKYRASVRSVAHLVGSISKVFIGIFGLQLSKYHGLIPYYMYMGFVLIAFIPLTIMYRKNPAYYNARVKQDYALTL